MAKRKKTSAPKTQLTAQAAVKTLRKFANPKRAKLMLKFFRTGKGEYGEGDIFIGNTMPQIRVVAKEFHDLPLAQVTLLLRSKIHEDRMLGLIILNSRFAKADDAERKKIYQLFWRERKGVNNWDLVDASAPNIVGGYHLERDRAFLFKMAKSKNLWERRIAIVSTLWFVRRHDLDDALKLAEVLRNDTEDLMHKAVGWVLREVGKKNVAKLEKFLERHATFLPRTALRYSIERFPEEQRLEYLQRKRATSGARANAL